MVRRDLAAEVNRCTLEFPVVTITGPRQSGKTTLARSLFPRYRYINFELPNLRDAFRTDPLGMLESCEEGGIFDEAQRVPELFSYLQVEVDRDPRPGRFVITGSEHFGLSSKISQSLAGRTAVLELLPFSYPELVRGGFQGASLEEVLWNGAYPPVHDRRVRPRSWYASYLATYLERDLRQLAAIQDLDLFRRFMILAAGRVGQLLNTANLGSDVGVDNKTISRWFSLLQTSFLAVKIQPHERNFRKRLVKTPKIYFLDTGLVCHLLGIESPDQLISHPLRGALFENWVVGELLKHEHNQGRAPRLSFWRTHGGQEVDLIRTRGQAVDLIECKSGQTIMPSMIKPLTRVSRLWEADDPRRLVIYGGRDQTTILATHICPWDKIQQILES